VLQLGAKRNISVTQEELTAARANLTQQISEVMSEILQTQQGQNVRYSCSATSQALTGTEVLSTLPSSFVDEQVHFYATATALQEDLAGVGSSAAELEAYFTEHRARFDTVCLTAAVFSSESDAQSAAASVTSGTPFSTVAGNTTSSGGGPQGCDVLSDLESKLPSDADLASLPTGTVSPPVDDNGTYLLLQVTSRTPTSYSQAKAAVAAAVQEAGSLATQKALTAAERRSSVTLNPQYGVWVPVSASVLTPLTPEPTDVLNATANVGRAAPASSPAVTVPSSG
jgi:PPIC-type PPIASE domain